MIKLLKVEARKLRSFKHNNDNEFTNSKVMNESKVTELVNCSEDLLKENIDLKKLLNLKTD